MEPKKNPRYDIHRKRGLILQISLLLSLAIVLTAFNWSVPLTERPPQKSLNPGSDEVIPYVPVVYTRTQEQPAPPPLKKVPASLPVFVEVANDRSAEPDNPVNPIDQNGPESPVLPFGTIELPPEVVTDTTFRVVGKMPEPVGGYEEFYKTLQKNLKYPKAAQRSGATGKVFIEFTVKGDGALEDFKILKGIGYGCDEEARRVLALTKWNGGRQRGRPVKVRLVQQVVFALDR